jgi:zinc protease
MIQTLVEVMRLKFREVLREDLGGTYGVSIGASTQRDPYESYQLAISWGCDPERVDELSERVMVQIDSLQAFGIDASYLEKVRETSRRTHEKRLKENGFWLRSLQFVDQHGQDPMTILEGSADFLSAVSPETIKEAANEYLNTENYAKFVLIPNEAGPDDDRDAGSDSQ